jgi:hypothetical protein
MTANNPVFYLNYGNGSSTGYYAVGVWAATTAYTVGQFVRQTAPAVANERLFICIVAGTSLAAEPTWILTKGAKTVEAAGPTWMECTGMAATNNDITNTQVWASAAGSRALGDIIQNVAGTYLFIYTTAGTGKTGTEPAWGTTTGNTTADNTATVTCIGATGAFANWANPGARLITLNKSTWTAAGNTIYIAKAHAETSSASMTISGVGTAQLPVKTICVDQAGSVPPVAANIQTTPQASITVTGTSVFSLSACNYVSGMTFSSARTSSGALSICAVDQNNYYKNCSFVLAAASGTPGIDSSNKYPAALILDNCTMSMPVTGAVNTLTATWKNTTSAVVGAAVPTVMFSTGIMVIDGVDLSALGSGKTLFGATNSGSNVVNCRLGASVTIAATPTQPGTTNLINSDSGATGYRQERYQPVGTLTTETTYVRAASDGVQTISWKVVTNANAAITNPFSCFEIVTWVSSTGSKTATVEIENGGVTLTNAEVWMDVEYLGSASYPLTSVISTGVATPLTAGTNITISTPTPDWSGGLGSAIKQKMVTGSFTVNTIGLVRATVYVARPSLTVYVDPVLTIA